ncbi:MAG: PAS domain S-box protein [Methanoregula sp.]|jgi:PAS domain S-box-containing protein|uniref:PAS domain S-box protein n=1 Tax=Methanoregula sp. TaxID=2052170 RepID=UPI003C2574C5
MEEYLEEISRIKEEIEKHPEGLSITDIAGLLGINRNSVAKYMDILQIQGSVDGRKRGTSKVYYISHRIPADSLRKVCSRPFVALDQDCLVTDNNQQFSRLTGRSPEQMLGQPFDKLPFRSLEGGTAQQIFRAALKGLEQRVHAQIMVDMEERPVNLSLIPLVFTTGKPGVAVIVDNERTAPGNESVSAATGPEFPVLLDNQIEYAVRFSPEGIIQYINEPYCHAIAKSREDMIGRPFKHLVSADDAERIRANRSRLSIRYPAGMIEFRAIMANGEARWQRWWDRALFDDRGQLAGYFSCGLDITDEVLVRTKLKKTQDMLEETIVTRTNELREINRQLYEEMTRRENIEQQLLLTQFAMDNAADMVFWVNRNGRADYANKAAVTGLGYTADELSNLTPEDVFALPVTNAWGDIWEHLKREGTITHKTVMIRKDGTRMPVEMLIRFLEYHKNEFACCFCRDISERIRMEHTLHLANKKLNVLTSLARHDIQNKITVLLGYLGRARKRERDPVVLGYLERQEHAAKAIRDEITITRDFKDLGADPPEWLDIRDVVAAAVTRYSESQVKFSVDLPAIFVYADRQMERVFSRLFENAVDAEHPPHFIRVFSRAEQERFVVAVEYDGPGIRPEGKEKIFELGAETYGHRGLFIIREILSLTDITIEETGEYGNKARFEIGIPPVSYRQISGNGT